MSDAKIFGLILEAVLGAKVVLKVRLRDSRTVTIEGHLCLNTDEGDNQYEVGSGRFLVDFTPDEVDSITVSEKFFPEIYLKQVENYVENVEVEEV